MDLGKGFEELINRNISKVWLQLPADQSEDQFGNASSLIELVQRHGTENDDDFQINSQSNDPDGYPVQLLAQDVGKYDELEKSVREAVMAGNMAAMDQEAGRIGSLPPIFRVILMVVVGMVGFGVDLQVLQYNLDPHDGTRTFYAEIWEVIALCGLIALWVISGPFRGIQKASIRILRRLLSPSIQQTIQFSDVIAADILTSFAKVLGDVWLSFVILVCLCDGIIVGERVLWSQQSSMAIPILSSVPYLIRLRQCISEYRTSAPLGRQPKSKRPLYNALKYASAFPVIWLSAWQQNAHDVLAKNNARHTFMSMRLDGLFPSLWLVSVLFNTLFSFWWDITNDWGLDLLLPSSFSKSLQAFYPHWPTLHRRFEPQNTLPQDKSALDEQEEGIVRPVHARRQSILRVPEKPLPLPMSVYYVFIIVDLLLRFTWSLKLSSHLQYLAEWQCGLLLLEALELIRRSVWVILRVEWEIVRRGAI
ncbi:protein-ER retention protein [Malassezia vespertilionis]|uniref:protein-ER retention protein n=1 Tax=Malassezia vespertilionis TaxID=2020962 RepID=UPI0024B1539F|nr:protein-ER retention protein [Malassezia vespertilionis]WFD06813.1 protein-ER retention protein [Malassezia vespertilionis]